MLTAQAGPSPALLAEFPFEYRDGLLWVRVAAAGSPQPLHLLLDTGAAVSTLDSETARRLGARSDGPVIARGVHSQSDAHWVSRVEAHIAGLPLPRKLLAVDLGALSRVCDRRVDGLLGADFFRGRVVQIRFASQTVRLLTAADPGDDSLVLPLRTRRGAMCVPIRVNGNDDQWVRLDTGCASALQWVTRRPIPSCACCKAAGLTEMAVRQARTTVEIGAERFAAVLTGLHEQEMFSGEAGLLGNELLSRFTVTVDREGGRVILNKRG